MNNDQIKGKWHQVKGSVKARWGKLTDDDLAEIDGDTERLYGKIQERHGETREDIKRELDRMSA